MAMQINMRDVPENVRDEPAVRATLQGKSMWDLPRRPRAIGFLLVDRCLA